MLSFPAEGLRVGSAGDCKCTPRANETIDANTLVIDYPRRRFDQLRQLAWTFVQPRTAVAKPGIYQAVSEEKESCGLPR